MARSWHPTDITAEAEPILYAFICKIYMHGTVHMGSLAKGRVYQLAVSVSIEDSQGQEEVSAVTCCEHFAFPSNLRENDLLWCAMPCSCLLCVVFPLWLQSQLSPAAQVSDSPHMAQWWDKRQSFPPGQDVTSYLPTRHRLCRVPSLILIAHADPIELAGWFLFHHLISLGLS